MTGRTSELSEFGVTFLVVVKKFKNQKPRDSFEPRGIQLLNLIVQVTLI